MSRDDWYRNAAWNDAIAASFDAKLRRAKHKGQYLRNQAGALVERQPDVALALLDRYFEIPDQFDAAEAYCCRALAYLKQGHIEQALDAYENALAREAKFPQVLTQAYLGFPYEVATKGLTKHYSRARELLDQSRNRLTFPVEHFKWNTAQALIATDEAHGAGAYAFARAAIEASERSESGMRHHPTIGLVTDTYADVLARLRKLCAA
jgi:tetratricopeptide (TPR) repeat protein